MYAASRGKTYSNTVSKMRKPSGGSLTRSGTSASRTKPNMVTFQRDANIQYRYKKMPRRKKKKWLQFKGKVKAVEASGRGTQQVVINSTFVGTVPNENEPITGNRYQGVSEVNLYSVNAESALGGRDKDIILNEVSNYRELKNTAGVEIPDLALATADELQRLKVPMNNAQIDITYTNAGNTPLEVDFYTIVHKNVPHTQFNAATPASGYESLESAQATYNQYIAEKLYFGNTGVASNAPGSEIRLDYRGVTPFQTWGILKYTGAKIINKTKVLISPGNSVTRRYSDRRHKNIYAHSTQNLNRYDKDTTTYLATFKPSGPFTGEVPEALRSSLRTSFTKVYQWTQEGQKNPRQTYLAI